MEQHLLEVQELHTSFFTHMGEVQAVRGVSFYVDQGEVIGVIGESGCGKSVTALSIMGLLSKQGRVTEKCGSKGRICSLCQRKIEPGCGENILP